MAHGSSGITTGDANQNKQNRRKSFNFLAYKPKTKQNKKKPTTNPAESLQNTGVLFSPAPSRFL